MLSYGENPPRRLLLRSNDYSVRLQEYTPPHPCFLSVHRDDYIAEIQVVFGGDAYELPEGQGWELVEKSASGKGANLNKVIDCTPDQNIRVHRMVVGVTKRELQQQNIFGAGCHLHLSTESSLAISEGAVWLKKSRSDGQLSGEVHTVAWYRRYVLCSRP